MENVSEIEMDDEIGLNGVLPASIVPMTKILLNASNGSDSGLERLPCVSDQYFDRSFESD